MLSLAEVLVLRKFKVSAQALEGSVLNLCLVLILE